jgi:hypothetical protein
VANNHDIKDLTSHGRGRWFEPSIAHSGNVLVCRTNCLTLGKVTRVNKGEKTS